MEQKQIEERIKMLKRHGFVKHPLGYVKVINKHGESAGALVPTADLSLRLPNFELYIQYRLAGLEARLEYTAALKRFEKEGGIPDE